MGDETPADAATAARAPATLGERLLLLMPQAKKKTLKEFVESGRVLVNGEPARKLKQAVAPADRVQVLPRAPRSAEAAKPLRILREDRDIVVVYKPHGLISSTTERERRTTAVSILRRYLRDADPKAQIGVIHRLDRDAAGILVFSKNPHSFRRLKDQFFHHAVERQYHAVVRGIPAERRWRMESELEEDDDQRVHTAGKRQPGRHQAGKGAAGKRGRSARAITEFEVVARGEGYALLRAKLHTGRKHQIRVQLSELGHPIVNDTMYPARIDPAAGSARAAKGAGQKRRPTPARRGDPDDPPPRAPRSKDPLMLIATRLVFRHPASETRVRIELPLPPRFEKMLRKGAAPEPAKKQRAEAEPRRE